MTKKKKNISRTHLLFFPTYYVSYINLTYCVLKCRHIDGASFYENEREVGEGIKEGLRASNGEVKR